MEDYDRIARALCYLDRHRLEQPSLADVSAFLKLSPSHFQRIFRQWAGISPKDYLQHLTWEDARCRLQQGESVLDAALASGLSGPGRLHDLAVHLEAASPGEIKSGGDGLELVYGMGMTPFGQCLLGETSRGICHLCFVEEGEFEGAARLLASQWPRAQKNRCDERVQERLSDIFQIPPKTGVASSLRAWVVGSDFQVRVWRALLHIPPGALATYGSIARALQKSGAARAVGQAVGANPIAMLIPCHRVIRQSGALGGYRWGDARKRQLLAWERAIAERGSDAEFTLFQKFVPSGR